MVCNGSYENMHPESPVVAVSVIRGSETYHERVAHARKQIVDLATEEALAKTCFTLEHRPFEEIHDELTEAKARLSAILME